jgi:hypothetical protein
MHLLSAHNRSEFLATPQLIRFDYVEGRDGFEPALLIKGSSLLLKYIAMGARMQLAFAQLELRLLYALKVYDDEEKAGVLWSILERDEEKAAFAALMRGETCQAFLFNELAVNVAWAAFPIFVEPELTTMFTGVATGQIGHSALKGDASLILDRFHNESTSSAGLIIADVPGTTAWNRCLIISSRATQPVVLSTSSIRTKEASKNK